MINEHTLERTTLLRRDSNNRVGPPRWRRNPKNPPLRQAPYSVRLKRLHNSQNSFFQALDDLRGLSTSFEFLLT